MFLSYRWNQLAKGFS